MKPGAGSIAIAEIKEKSQKTKMPKAFHSSSRGFFLHNPYYIRPTGKSRSQLKKLN
jgi:hypothetical protein